MQKNCMLDLLVRELIIKQAVKQQPGWEAKQRLQQDEAAGTFQGEKHKCTHKFSFDTFVKVEILG